MAGTDDQQYRSFASDLEVRSGGDGRTVVGIAVPYGREQRINAGLTEVFMRGAFAHQLRAGHRVPFTRNHLPHGGDVIGKTTLLREDASGLYGEWRVSATPRGDETLTLIKDGVLTELSIGFRQPSGGYRRNDRGVIERTKAHLTEVASVVEGAYGQGAVVAGVRAAGAPCPHCGAAAAEDAPTSHLEAARALLDGLPDLRSQSNLDNTPDGRKLWDYWLRGAGAAKWVGSAHPYTTLTAALRAAGVPGKSIKGLAANLFKAKFGIWPGERKGDNPVGKG